jgi:hypothetical protein
MLHRYGRRFGGSGTIVTLADGRAFTAAHCLAPVDGTPGVVIGLGPDRWRVVRRWSPMRTDLALLEAVGHYGAARLAARALVRLAARVEFVGHTGRCFHRKTATVIAVTETSATAMVEHRSGVCAGDSGGPVLIDGVLVGIVTHRAGPVVSSQCSSHLVLTRLDSPTMRRRLREALTSARGQ